MILNLHTLTADSGHSSSRQSQGKGTAHAGDSAARIAGSLLILTAATTVFAVVARVTVAADQPTLAESLHAIAENRAIYAASGAARLASALLLIAGAWYLSRTWVVREGWGSPLVPTLFAASGILTAVSGIAVAALAATAPAEPDAAILVPTAAAEAIDLVRWLAGKCGFAVAGLALLVAARQQWKSGGMMRRLAPVSALIGLSMQFIWVDFATFMHPFSGAAFVLWLVLIGSMLAGGLVERHFRGMSVTRQEESIPSKPGRS